MPTEARPHTPDCAGLPAVLGQLERPRWEPLLEAVGERLAERFMWMHEERLADGTPVQAYKHAHTRSYLLLADGNRAYAPTACDRLAPVRLDVAIEQALCSWWLLSGWEVEDVEAIRHAVLRARALDRDPSDDPRQP